ncbi:MAG: MBL fold metallo-hydrolase [Woeseiaceae bacterium]|nr:MBL fold metallo-hydrolase [Woeseiaceae bacterium]
MTIRTFTKTLALAFLGIAAGHSAIANETCSKSPGVALQILGSGGPIADDGRASSGYLVWIDGETRVLIDAGGGTFLRFGEAGASFAELDFVGLSHFHTDHSADFAALLKSGNFSARKQSLRVAGPAGARQFPGLNGFLTSLFDGDSGAYAYLSSYLDGTSGTPMLTRREVGQGEQVIVYTSDDLVVDAMRVPHGIVPAVAFRVRSGEDTIVFASDQNGGDPAFAEFAADASILVMHMVVPEDIAGVGRRLHAPPSVIGTIAATANPDTLVLSHFMARSLRDLGRNVELVRERYRGEVVLADDLMCVLP